MTSQDVKPRSARRAVAVGLERLHLQRPALRLAERVRTLPALPERLSTAGRKGPDGLPVPPPYLRSLVSSKVDAKDFLEQGKRSAEAVRDAVSRSGRQIESFESMLDFGCGCGRVLRRWADLRGPRIVGTDYNPKLIRWCRKNLRFASFEVNALQPPLPFADAEFDLVYALSVFTHLTEPMQRDWIAELRRVLRPGGVLVFSTRGDAWSWKLEGDELSGYEAGELVVRYGGVEGTNLCAAWHPPSYVRASMSEGFTVVESLPARLLDGNQDMHVLVRDA